MVATTTGPCEPWEPIWCDLPTGSAAVTGNAVQIATEILWQASGQRFGLCTVTLRPCRRECAETGWQTSSQTWPQPTLRDGQWTNVVCGGCTTGCSCTELEEAVLPAPVYDVVEVKLDGGVLVTGSYRVDDDRILVRTDGGVWPSCQDLAAPDSEVNTWSVTARYGEPVPTLGRQAVGELAAEVARACLGEECRLPANVASLVRQGITITFPEAAGLAERGYFGGLFIETFNPDHLRGRARVYDLDGPGPPRRTGT